MDVTVQPGRNQRDQRADQFTYTATAPTVTSISPNSGPPAGGTSVTITGANFTGATAVKFGSANATSFTVNSATSITATSPAGSGTVDVTVTTPGGTSPTSAADRFSYVSVTVTTTSLPAATFGSSYTAPALTASGGTSPYTFAATGLPSGLTLTNGVISGTPTQSGTSPSASPPPTAPRLPTVGRSPRPASRLSLMVNQATQTISFTKPADQTFAPGGTVALSATGGASGNPVVFTSNSPSVCTVSGSTATIVAAGTCSITANQAGNANYCRRNAVTQTFAIGKALQTISFTKPADQTFSPGATVALTATGGASGNPIIFTSNSPSVCTVSGSTATIVAAGTCSITANQAGNANYAAATPVTQTFAVGKAIQTISFTKPADQTFSPGATVALTATGGASGNPVTFASLVVCRRVGCRMAFSLYCDWKPCVDQRGAMDLRRLLSPLRRRL